MDYVYDGSFAGLLTVIFVAYRNLETIAIKKESDQASLFTDAIKVETDYKLAKRVEIGLTNKFSPRFFRSVSLCFRSFEEDKEEVIAKTVKGMYREGFAYLKSPNKAPVKFNAYIKNVLGENHDYKGLLRFEELADGTFYARFRPKNDILDLIYSHFVDRMPKEKFIIHDLGRNLAIFYKDGLVDLMELSDFSYETTREEEYFSKAWQKFYQAVKIDERENKKLMAANMPKYRWEFLTEKNLKDD